MKRWRCWSLFLGLSLGSACTKENPAYHCQNSTCIDPSFPYCDADGSIGGTAGVCIAVTCTTGEFGKCSGDSALTCNDSGTGYVETQCAHGCEEGSGCRLCEAGQTVCANGTVATCDTAGVQTSTTSCPLGCFDAEPRCRDIDPSNGLGTYLDSVSAPPNVDLTDQHYIVYVDTGEVLDGAQNNIAIPTFVAVQSGSAPAIRVFVTNDLKLGDVEVRVKNPVYTDVNPALAFLSQGEITVSGTTTLLGLYATPGGVWSSDCKGGATTYSAGSYYPGTGGGGFATVGAHGGNAGFNGGVGGGVSGNDTLIPLRGGCGSGGTSDDSNPHSPTFGAAGGGALQMVSRKKISVLDNAQLDVSAPGGFQDNQLGAFGGGGGGGLLIEAPIVELGNNAKLLATGGTGVAGDGAGVICSHPLCGNGGAGATPLMSAQPGQDVNGNGASVYGAGSGGGGLGRIRINTSDNTYMKTNTTVESGALTVGRITTR